ncbi:MAG: hypothetical protein H7Z14_01795 [Anaerolineae bacterium]|nr:hypothetical protein [Phycisphaerae bacterium]
MRGLERVICCLVLVAVAGCGAVRTPLRPRGEERLSFQAYDEWTPRVNLNADVAMVYGIDKSLPTRLETWTSRGYIPHVMTGVAWGEYQDYIHGQWDGQDHMDEIQTEKSGARIAHGDDVYYMSPGESYGKYLCVGVKRALDAGATAIHLEEPEYWVRSGWEENFKREWQAYYKEPWIEPDSSPDAQYRASKLKYLLYRRALAQVFDFVREYGKQHGRKIACYVPTHSLINYASWGIVSPESSLLEVGCDGYIAQVWTGTARTPNFYEGVKKERTFETAFLEYGVMQNLVRDTDRRMWFLNDPIEDNPQHSWFDYRTNWESTLIASLLQPEVWRYEIMPWPHRIFEATYPATQPVQNDTPRMPIPKEYETELQAVITAMGEMKQPAADVRWEAAGTQGVGVLVSDTMMFQRFGPDASDGELGSFYGLALPLLMRGMPVEPVQIETADLSRYKVLLLTYEGQKPPKPEFHDALTRWVRNGGALVVIDDDRDPFLAVREWWNSPPMNYRTPRRHLFDTLSIPRDREGWLRVGKGAVVFAAASPAKFSKSSDGGDKVRQLVRTAMNAIKLEWKESNALVLRRGPYVIASGLERSSGGVQPTIVRGRYISLFDPKLPVINGARIEPGERVLLLDLSAAREVGVVAAACRVLEEAISSSTITLLTDGIEATNGVVCIKLPRAPKSIRVNDQRISTSDFEYGHGVLRVRFTNHVKPTRIVITR